MYERDLQKKVIKWLRYQGYKVYKISDRFRAGIPDIYAAKNGCGFWIELKRPGERPTKLQQWEIDDLNRHGVPAIWVTSLEEVIAYVNQ